MKLREAAIMARVESRTQTPQDREQLDLLEAKASALVKQRLISWMGSGHDEVVGGISSMTVCSFSPFVVDIEVDRVNLRLEGDEVFYLPPMHDETGDKVPVKDLAALGDAMAAYETQQWVCVVCERGTPAYLMANMDYCLQCKKVEEALIANTKGLATL